VSYTLNVCNTGLVNANDVIVTDIAPDGFVLVGSIFNGNDCAVEQDSTYDVDAECCFSLILNYSAAGAQQQFYDNQGVELSGPLAYDYIDFDGNSTTQEDVTIDGTIDCPSTVIEFTKEVNVTEICDESFVEFTFTINNEMNVPLQGLTFSDILPDPCIWTFVPYAKEGLTISSSSINGNEASFVIDKVEANTVATFKMDAQLNTWDNSGVLFNTAILENVPDLDNGGLTTLTSNTTETVVTSSPQISLPDTIIVFVESDTVDLSATISGDATLSWTTEGDGSFIQETLANTSYILGESDVDNGAISLFLSAMSDCNDTGAGVIVQLYECNLEVEVIEITDCNVNGTPLDGSDDTYEVTFSVSNDSIYQDNQVLLTTGAISDTITYDEIHTITLSVDGVVDVLSFVDLQNDFCETQVEVFQDYCTDECILSIVEGSFIEYDCDDNGTPRDSTDDFYVVEFVTTSHNASADSTYLASYDGVDYTFTLGDIASLTLPADGIEDSILLTMDIGIDTCSLWLATNQENCYTYEPCLDLLENVSIIENVISDCDDYEAVLTAIVEVVDTLELSYTWRDANGDVVGENEILEVDEQGIYTLTVMYCDQTETAESELNTSTSSELSWPKVFFPNGSEEANRTFGPYNPCDITPSSYTLKIYNKWGNEVFVSDDISMEWDGRHNGEASASAVYVYVVEYGINGMMQPVVKGDVTLLR